jgi:hypothetical protein
MTTAADFRVFHISSWFIEVDSSDAESAVAKVTASGKPADFSFRFAADFERVSKESQAEAIRVWGEFRLFFGKVLFKVIPVITTIPSGKLSITDDPGHQEVSFDMVDVNKQPIFLEVEFWCDQRCLASSKYKVTFPQT